MTSRDFVYFLQGYFEIGSTKEGLSAEQVETIKNHLNLVFYHEIDPSYTPNKTKQAEMQAIHDGKPKTNKPISDYNNHDDLIRC